MANNLPTSVRNLVNPHQNRTTLTQQYPIINKYGEEGDGQIRSVACSKSKNGPYRCSRCSGVFLTSQQFAAHVSSFHYKFETQDQRRKRRAAKMMSRKTRSTTLKMIPHQHAQQDGSSLTIVPVFYAASSSKVVVKEQELLLGTGNDSVVPPGFEGLIKFKGEP